MEECEVDVGAVLTVMTEVAGAFGLIEISKRAYNWLKDKARARQETEEVKDLLGIRREGIVAYRHDSVHALYPRGLELHPDNLAALTALAGSEFARAKDLKSIQQLEVVKTSLKNNLVLIGSPTAEGLSRPTFGYEPDVDMDSLALKSPPLDLPFKWILSKTEIDERAKIQRLVPGKGVVVRPNWRIEGEKKLYVPEADSSGFLSVDYLLVTRIPNFLTPDALDAGKYIVSFGGSHGTATRAVELLLRDQSVLRKIAELLLSKPSAFQILLRASSMKHDERLGTHATKIEVVEGPIILSHNYQAWRTAAKIAGDNLSKWLSQSKEEAEENQ